MDRNNSAGAGAGAGGGGVPLAIIFEVSYLTQG